MIGDDLGDDADDQFWNGVDPDSVLEGAAADSADGDLKDLEGLPRILRYALLGQSNQGEAVPHRLVAEIEQLCPDLPANAAWAAAQTPEAGAELATELDRLAVLRDLPLLRSLADCVRLLSLRVPCDAGSFAAFRRVTRAMIIAFGRIAPRIDDQQCAELERVVYGWALLPAAAAPLSPSSAIEFASPLGERSARYRIRSAVLDTAVRVRRSAELQVGKQKEKATPPAPPEPAAPSPLNGPVATNHVIVGQIDEQVLKANKFIEPFRPVLNAALPLVETPVLHEVRTALSAEFPYAAEVIDFALTDLISRPTIKLRPLLLVGEPGSGKSRFARRLAEVLGVAIWRTDAAQADGNTFAGTDRRWHSAEPCHPMLAIARGRIANPILLIDELEKAGTRTDHGRLWDCLLGLLEPETSARYPDPALQIQLDLSHVSYVATANTLAPLPSPLRDRFRITAFPTPEPKDIDALLPALIDAIAADHGVDSRWIAPLDPQERDIIAASWPGGSVRRLRRILEAMLQARDRSVQRH